jgi:hypothetical protein
MILGKLMFQDCILPMRMLCRPQYIVPQCNHWQCISVCAWCMNADVHHMHATDAQ